MLPSISDTMEEIRSRYFDAVQIIVERDCEGSKRRFEREVGISHGNLLQRETGRLTIQTKDIALLVKKYNVSPDWLFTGKGGMFSGMG